MAAEQTQQRRFGNTSRIPARIVLKRDTKKPGTVRIEYPARTVSVPVINQDLFEGALHRERMCADRTNSGLVLLLVSAGNDPSRPVTTDWKPVIDALAAGKRDTDLLGWYQSDTTLGVIMPNVDGDGAGVAAVVKARISQELSKRVPHEALEHLKICFHQYPEPKQAERPALVDVAPLSLQSSRRHSVVNEALKRMLDIAGSAALLMVLSPLLLVVAVLVKLKSPGPVFFKQTRIGQMKKPFAMFKFRTMHVNADSAVHHAFVSDFIKAKGTTAASSGTEPVFKITSDSRITPIGQILRKTSIDELPQLWNVLRGDMSLVGPRPPLQYEVDQYEQWHCRRVLEAKPGVTGLWQVTGRSRTTFDEMVRLDLRYARTSSLWTDVKILLATPGAVIVGKGAC